MKSYTLGIFLILIGGFFMLDSFIFENTIILTYLLSWRSIILMIALFNIYKNIYSLSEWLFLYFALLVNVPRFTHWYMGELFGFTFPIILILYGLLILINKGNNGKLYSKILEINSDDLQESHILTKKDYLLKGQLSDKKLSFLFSSVTLDLRELDYHTNQKIVFDNTHIFSKITIMLPIDWIINTNDTQIFSGTKNNIKSINRNKSINIDGCHLYLRNYNIFSKVEILS
ncbi:MAG: hypothetical protein KAI79_11705 [Bacteroidales bacterium]|nr:hypothetical protein [Bacteroidales bacterium]